MTNEQITKFKELFEQGINNSEIARQIGVERHAISRYIKKHHLISPNTIQPGQRYGSLVTIKPTEHRDQCGRVLWLCKCDCGTIKEVDSSALRRGTIKSCGCSRIGKGLDDLTGQRFGKLVVLKRGITKDSHKVLKWLCQCDCGNVKEVSGESLRKGNTISCGCVVSKGEFLLRKYLKQYNINFKTQYSFEDLLSQKKYPLRFDFAIFNKQQLYCLIEFQGPQHYDKNNQWHTLELEYNDEAKIKYCQEHEYNLFLINSIKDIETIVKGIAIKIND